MSCLNFFLLKRLKNNQERSIVFKSDGEGAQTPQYLDKKIKGKQKVRQSS